ncbi:uncharacterized protein LOC119578524 [Penaeus monodon]|uniref:uncharacterized protein LOC119578524 n=1 Tax=Penaeus monodon TaxID=6687 RepID=UPI0018A7D2ED|nr:uncharacterized protein LOC119578524 [Penaeus monodon]
MLQRIAPQLIHEELRTALGDSALIYPTAKRCAAPFQQGRDSGEDDPRSVGPSTTVTKVTVAMVESMALRSCRNSVQYFASQLGISNGSVVDILHEHFNLRKVSAEWVPRLVAPGQEKSRIMTFTEMLNLRSITQEHRIMPNDWHITAYCMQKIKACCVFIATENVDPLGSTLKRPTIT